MNSITGGELSSTLFNRLTRQLEHGTVLVSRRRFALLLGCLLGAIIPILLSIAFAPPMLGNEMPGATYRADGILSPPDNSYGFSEAQVAVDGTTYSETDSHATITFPYAANIGRYAHVGLRLSSASSTNQPPLDVTLSLNGRIALHLRPTSSYQIYEATVDTQQVPNPNLDPSHVQVDLKTSAPIAAQDGRQFGVAIDWIRLEPQRSLAEIVTEVIVWIVGILAVLLVATRRLSQRWAILFGLATLATFALIHLSYQPRAIDATTEIALAALAWVLGVSLAPKDRPVWGLGFVTCALWVVLAGHWLIDWRMDDSYISYRYAWNLVHGHGLVYNPGEIVEGYTNFLWTALAAAGIAVGLHPPTLMLVITLALSLCLIGLVYLLGRKLSGEASAWPLLAVVLLSFDTSFDTYGVRGSGIEAVPFACIVLGVIAAIWATGDKNPVASRVLAGLMLAAASLTRPEGLFVAMLLLGIKAWQDRVAGQQMIKLLFAALVPYLAIVVPYQIWRISFYGYLFPNTFYAKTGNPLTFLARGWDYSQHFFVTHWLVMLLLLVGLGLGITLWLKRLRRGEWRPKIAQLPLALALLTTIYTCYIITVGGDDFPAHRFFVPLIAPLVLLATVGARKALDLLPSTGRVKLLAGAAIVVSVAGYVAGSLRMQGPQQDIGFHTNAHSVLTDKWAAAGLWLRDNTTPQTSVAVLGAGAIAYYSQRPTIDILGLNDVHIAHIQVPNMGYGRAGHEKSDPAYVLSRAPSYMLAYAENLSPFADFSVELDRYYENQTVRSPIGLEIPWLHRKAEDGR